MAHQRKPAALAAMALVLLLSCAPAATPVATPSPASRATSAPAPTVAPTAAPNVAALPPTPTARPTQPAPTPAPAASSTSGQPRHGGVIRYAILRDPPTWNPFIETVDPLTSLRSLVFTSLFTWWVDPAQNCQRSHYPLAIQEWRWLDDTTVEFTLKKGIKYHNKPPVNGREAVAADFAATFPLYQKGLGQGMMAGALGPVETATATGKYSFQMKSKTPWGGLFEELLAHMYGPWLAPPEAGGPDNKLWDTPEKALIGSGPFLFDKRQPGVSIGFARNPDYWQPPLPYVDRVDFVMIPDASTQAAAFRAGKLDMISEMSESLLGDLQRSVPTMQVNRCPGASLTGAGTLFMPVGAPPFNDVRVRRAVSMAIDRQFIMDTFYMGKAAYPGVMGSGMPMGLDRLDDYPPDVRQTLEYHPDRAKQLLAEAGYPNGVDTVLNFTTRYPQPQPMIAEAIASMLGKVGIRAKLDLMESGRYMSVVIGNTFADGEAALNPLTVTTPEGALALATFWSKSGRTNRSRVKDPEYDKLYELFQRTRDQGERTKLARDMQLMAADKAWRVALPIPDSTMAAQAGIRFTWPGNTRNLEMVMATAWR